MGLPWRKARGRSGLAFSGIPDNMTRSVRDDVTEEMPVGMPRAFCHAKLPNAGLGNKLFVWAKAHTFSMLNQLPLSVSGWTQFQKGPLVRGFDLRLYWNYFKRVDQVNWRSRRYAQRNYVVVCEPPVGRIDIEAAAIYEYSAVPSWKDYFGSLREYRGELRDALMRMLTRARLKELERQRAPVISVNVRMGDFRKLQPQERFDQLASGRTTRN